MRLLMFGSRPKSSLLYNKLVGVQVEEVQEVHTILILCFVWLAGTGICAVWLVAGAQQQHDPCVVLLALFTLLLFGRSAQLCFGKTNSLGASRFSYTSSHDTAGWRISIKQPTYWWILIQAPCQSMRQSMERHDVQFLLPSSRRINCSQHIPSLRHAVLHGVSLSVDIRLVTWR